MLHLKPSYATHNKQRTMTQQHEMTQQNCTTTHMLFERPTPDSKCSEQLHFPNRSLQACQLCLQIIGLILQSLVLIVQDFVEPVLCVTRTICIRKLILQQSLVLLKAIQNVQQILIVLGDLDRMLQCIFAKFHIPSTCAHRHGLSSLFAQDELF